MYIHYEGLCRCSLARFVLSLTLAILSGPSGSVIYHSWRPYPVSNSFATTLGAAALLRCFSCNTNHARHLTLIPLIQGFKGRLYQNSQNVAIVSIAASSSRLTLRYVIAICGFPHERKVIQTGQRAWMLLPQHPLSCLHRLHFQLFCLLLSSLIPVRHRAERRLRRIMAPLQQCTDLKAGMISKQGGPHYRI